MIRSLVKIALYAVVAVVGYSVYKAYTATPAYAAKGTLAAHGEGRWLYTVKNDQWSILAKDDPAAPDYHFQGTSDPNNKTKKFDSPMTFEGKTLDDLLAQIDSFYT